MEIKKQLIDVNEFRKLFWSKLQDLKFVGPMDVDHIILNTPTVDAVEVVWCKNCRFLIDREDGTHGCYRHFVEQCELDDFCSYGERTL